MKVLLAIEDEAFGNAIADFVTNYKWPRLTTIRLTHVMDWAPDEKELLASQVVAQAFDAQHEAAQNLLQNLMERLRTALPDISFETMVLKGHPAEQILAMSNGWSPDLLIVGSHGRKGASLFFKGSVSQSLATHVSCSILILRLPGASDDEPEEVERAK